MKEQTRKHKKRTSFLAVLFLLTVSMVFGASAVYGGTTKSAPVASDMKITMDGAPLVSDVDVYIESGYSLLPARVIVEKAGGDIEWDGDKQKVTIHCNNKKVELVINSGIAEVDGVATKLDIPPRLVVVDKKGGSRAMVPVRFVSESLGFGVGYNDSIRTIQLTSPEKPQTGKCVELTSVTSDRGENVRRIVIEAEDAMAGYSSFKLKDPSRYVLDIKGAAASIALQKTVEVKDELSPVKAVRTGQFSSDTARIVLELSADRNPSVFMSKDKKTLTIEVADFAEGEEEPVVKKPASLSEVLIVIDPGHGGPDPGSLGKKNGAVVLNEKEPNLDVALRLNQKLQAAGFKTIMTRDSDRFASASSKNAKEDLISRTDLANSKNATLIISIHNNSAGNITAARGTETLYNETEGKAEYGISSKELAQRVQKKMVAYCGTANRGAKSRPDLSILRRSEMPAIIVEGAFMSNQQDLALLQTSTFRENYARAVADATIEYLTSIFK